MKSNLNINDFRNRLKELTSEEKASYIVTPYNSSKTPFCGTFDDTTFELTRNSIWRFIKGIVIEGQYKASDNDFTEVEYQLGRTRFTRNIFIAVNCLGFLGFNTFIFINQNRLELPLHSILLTINGCLILGNLWALICYCILKKMINQRFREEFEIGIADEDE